MSKICQLELDIFCAATPAEAATDSATVHQHILSSKPVPFRWPGAVAFENSNPRTKLADNMAALRLLRQLRQGERKADQREQETLAKYNGWGGHALVFEADPREWRDEADELKMLLSPMEYSSAQATVTSAFYTPNGLCQGIYEAVARLGFAGGKILEPSAGTGVFLATQPSNLVCDWTAVELDIVTGLILEQLQPQARVQICGLQDATLSGASFDLVVGTAALLFADALLRHDEQRKMRANVLGGPRLDYRCSQACDCTGKDDFGNGHVKPSGWYRERCSQARSTENLPTCGH
jgi:hypothetical protein